MRIPAKSLGPLLSCCFETFGWLLHGYHLLGAHSNLVGISKRKLLWNTFVDFIGTTDITYISQQNSCFYHISEVTACSFQDFIHVVLRIFRFSATPPGTSTTWRVYKYKWPSRLSRGVSQCRSSFLPRTTWLIHLWASLGEQVQTPTSPLYIPPT